MHRTLILALAAAVAAAGAPRPAAAVSDVYLKIQDINRNLVVNGGVTGGPTGTNGSIRLDSFSLSFGHTFTPNATGGTLGPLEFSPVSLRGLLGAQSTAIAAASAAHGQFARAEIDVYKSAGGNAISDTPFAVWKFFMPNVAGYAADATASPGTESYLFDDFTSLSYTFTQLKPDGTAQAVYSAGWNRVQNNPSFPASLTFVATDPVITGDLTDLQFVTSVAVPEPTAACALAAAAGVLLSRRRR